MRVLLIKTSSMGDIIHTLPALTDAGHAIKNIKFDWVVEEAFTELPALHPLVVNVIPIAFRRLRKNLLSPQTWGEWLQFYQQLRKEEYDLILDAQSLIKSAWLTYIAKGLRVGLDFHSARESFAAFFYQKKYKVDFYQHAIKRMRLLFSLALNYDLPNTFPDIGFTFSSKQDSSLKPYIVFLHGTTWKTKEWPETYWIELAELAYLAGFEIKISGGRAEEIARAFRIGKGKAWIEVLPSLTIAEMAQLLANAKGAVAVDTGFGHLAAALGIPLVSLYGATRPDFTGAIGKYSQFISSHFNCAPCLKRTCHYANSVLTTPACYTLLPATRVWLRIQKIMQEASLAKSDSSRSHSLSKTVTSNL